MYRVLLDAFSKQVVLLDKDREMLTIIGKGKNSY